ncbi:hypothetical protein Lal_00021129, partial [Lupinus albus]
WDESAVACDPSTVRSQRCSLLCETSLTLCPLSLSPSTMPQLSTWSGHANMVQPPSQPNTTIAMFHHLDAPAWVTS